VKKWRNLVLEDVGNVIFWKTCCHIIRNARPQIFDDLVKASSPKNYKLVPWGMWE